jgi:periplasmic divalent cation tolerance protein
MIQIIPAPLAPVEEHRPMTEHVQVQTTVAQRADAERIAHDLVSRRLAACVQIVGPIRSVYRWQGRVETTEEWLCVAKTRADRFPALEAAILALHRYEVPEIVALPITAANATYIAWLDAAVSSMPSD